MPALPVEFCKFPWGTAPLFAGFPLETNPLAGAAPPNEAVLVPAVKLGKFRLYWRTGAASASF